MQNESLLNESFYADPWTPDTPSEDGVAVPAVPPKFSPPGLLALGSGVPPDLWH